jgi:primary-amine oxidase
MKAVRSFVPDESVSSIDWAENDAAMYAIVNKDTPNRFGESPGYRFKRSKRLRYPRWKDWTNADCRRRHNSSYDQEFNQR